MNPPIQSRPVMRDVSRYPIKSGYSTGPSQIACVAVNCDANQCCLNLPIIGNICIPNPIHTPLPGAKCCLESIFPVRVCCEALGQKFCI
jgi:hypothetical protein